MAKIYDSIKSLIRSGRIATGAAALEENEHKVAAATDIILPSMLASMLKKGDTPEIEEVLKEGKKIKAWENYDKIWHGSGVDEHVNIGERMENRVLGPLSSKLNTAVAHKTAMRTGRADRLTNWVAATVAGWFSLQVAGGKSYKALLGELADDKPALRKDIPADILEILGLGSLADTHTDLHKPAAPKPAAAPLHKDPVMIHTPEPRRKSMAWLWWLLGIILLALVIFWIARSCGTRKMAPVEQAAVTAVAPVEQAVTEVKEVHTDAAPKFVGIPMVLPDGTKITMYKGHLEEAVKAYLDSDKFKNGTDAELRSVWFEFTDIDFEHNKSTELMEGSPERLMVLVNTLKNYPNVKVKVGSFGDKTGTRAANYAISEKRALTIMETLKVSGFPAANLSHEGFGKEYAAAPTTASDTERAPDRDVAMRFTK